MHELSIALDVVELAVEEARKNAAAQILSVRIRLGQLSGVVPEALQGAFELAREGTALSQTRLVIEEVMVVVDCPVCRAHRGIPSIREICCVECGTVGVDVVQGRELELTAMEIR